MRRTQYSTLKSILLASAASILAQPSVVLAQNETNDDNVRDVITVTATKREESIQSVGLSISAISGEDLQARGAEDFEDYAVSIPNLAFGATDDGVLANRTISIRGIEGLNTTGFYIDDVPLDESIDPLVLDVERIEVLRGPQGTLYGARGLGGTVRVITKQPEFDAYTSRIHTGFSYTEEGGFNYIVDGSANLPLTENLALRLTAYYQDEEGIFDRVIGPSTAPGVVVAAGTTGAIVGDAATTVENVDDKKTYGGQIALRWQPSDAFEVTAKVLAQKTELSGFPLADFVFDPASPPSPIVLSADDFTQERLFNVDEFGEDQWIQASITGSYETDFGTFTSSTGYFERNTQEGEDTSEFISFTLLGVILPSVPLPTVATALPSPIFQELDFRTIVEEARFVSDFSGPFQMTAGVFYQRTDDDEGFVPENFAPGFDAAFSTQLNGGVPATGFSGVGDLIFTSNTGFEIKELGLYGEFSYDLTDRITATFGARYYDTETIFEDSQSGFAVGGIGAVDIGPLTQSEDGFNLKGLLEYEATDNIYLYASATEGFRIGGANGDLPAALGCPADAAALGVSVADARTFNSDSLWSYEGGAKTTWQDGRVTINAAAFYIDFDNIQQRVLLSCGFDFVANIGAARSAGFEVETTLAPADGLLMQFAAGYTDAQFTESVPGLVSDGDRLQQIPEWTISSTVDYEFPLGTQHDGFVRADLAHVGESISRVVDSGNPRIRPSYQILNARLGVRSGSFEIAAFIDNLLDEDAVLADNRTLAAEALGRPRIVRNRPRTFGIDIRANF